MDTRSTGFPRLTEQRCLPLAICALFLVSAPARGADDANGADTANRSAGANDAGSAKGTDSAKDPASAKPAAPSAREKARQRWENVVLFYGDEETGDWSLRIRDKDVHDKGWFEFIELWQFDRKDQHWHIVPTEKVSTAVVLPKNKPSDAPPDTQVLYPLKEIPEQTAGLWYAKWRMDGIEGGTLMRIGTARTARNFAPKGNPPAGWIKIAVPIDLEKSEAMVIPDPRVACVQGGSKQTKPRKKSDSD